MWLVKSMARVTSTTLNVLGLQVESYVTDICCNSTWDKHFTFLRRIFESNWKYEFSLVSKISNLGLAQVNTWARSLGLPSVPSNMARGWPLVAIMPGARHNQVGKYMLAIMADPSWQVRASRGGDDFGDKSTRGFFLHHWKCPLNSS